jgi:hypothetical protein
MTAVVGKCHSPTTAVIRKYLRSGQVNVIIPDPGINLDGVDAGP